MPGFDQNLLFRRFVVVFSWDRSPRFRTIREIERVCTQPATAIFGGGECHPALTAFRLALASIGASEA